MATTAITVQDAVEDGTTLTLTAVATGTTYTVDIEDDRPIVLLFTNGATGGTATVQGEALQSEFEAASEVVTLGASKTVITSPIDQGKYGASVSVTVTQTGTLAAVRLPLTDRHSID